ncbi:MAG TPA: TRAM domain-containing protein [Anaerolineae bacterium]|nr:TRAM domain-containing protein [Anaerolineae bacterium]
MSDDVSEEEKMRRFRALEDLQARIADKINRRYLGEAVEILVEASHKGKWRGRTRTNKLVFIEDPVDRLGQAVNVKITWTGPWSMQGVLAV